jgi:diaminobutyrate-2-oxoglutarate transaminase
MDRWTPGSHTSPFPTKAVNLAAATAAIGVMRRERLWERSATLGQHLLRKLQTGLLDTPYVGDVRGLGLFAGVEIVAPDSSHAPDPARSLRIRDAALARGVVVGGGGHFENVIKFAPPLTIDSDLMDRALDLVIAAVKETA